MSMGRPIAVVVVLSALLGACGGAGIPGGTSGPGTSTASGPAVDRARRDLCHDLLLVQSGFRPDALARLLPKLRADVDAFEQAKDAEDAQAVRRLEVAMDRLRRAVIAGRGVKQATNAVVAVLAHISFC
jgi:hypothetical protein